MNGTDWDRLNATNGDELVRTVASQLTRETLVKWLMDAGAPHQAAAGKPRLLRAGIVELVVDERRRQVEAPPAIDSKALTLTETLAALGLSHRKDPSGPGLYAHAVLDACGDAVFSGSAGAVWTWLRARRAIV